MSTVQRKSINEYEGCVTKKTVARRKRGGKTAKIAKITTIADIRRGTGGVYT